MNRLVPALLVLSLACVVGPLAAQDSEWNRYTLDGLQGVYIRAEANDACDQAGVSASSVQADASVTLIEADVPLYTEEQMLSDVALPELRISLECAAGNGDALAYAVGVRVQQAAKMIRDEQVTLPEAVTWYATGVGFAPRTGAASAIEEALAAKLQEFAAAYTAANAEEGGSR